MDWVSLKKALWTWASTTDSTATVIWAQQNAPFPKMPALTMRLYSVSSVSPDYVSMADNGGRTLITGNREFFCELQAFGGDALGRMEDLRMSLNLDTVKTALVKAGIVVVDTEPILNTSALNAPQIEDRASMDVRLRIAHELVDVPGIIDTVVLTGIYKDVDDRIISVDTSTITVNP